jgi:hypothetical protein
MKAMKIMKISELTQEQHEADVAVLLLDSDLSELTWESILLRFGANLHAASERIARLEETNAALSARLERGQCAYRELEDEAGHAAERMTRRVEALRDVQLLHSRALIELPPALDRDIIELIGPHPRDGEES